MSDARNSSNSLRGGGSRQTGGSGRIGRNIGGKNTKSEVLGQASLQAHNDRSEAKRNLQLRLTSKQLAADMRAGLLEFHTEEEYEEMNIPFPSEDTAREKLKSMKEFTQNWYDKSFREEWLKTVAEVWLQDLKAQYEAAVAAAKAKRNPPKEHLGEGIEMSVEELQEMIANLDVDTSPEERQRLKKKLKRKKQRMKEKEKEKAKKEAAE